MTARSGFPRRSDRRALLSPALAFAIALLWSGGLQSRPVVSCSGDRQAVALCETLKAQPASLGIDPQRLSELTTLYADRQYQAVWSGTPVSETRAVEVLSILGHADTDGLEPGDYRVDAPSATDPWQAARRDLLITDAVLRYAHDLRIGRIPADSSDADVDLPLQRFDIVNELEASIEHGTAASFLSEQRPPQQEYADLAEALADYRARAASGTWQVLRLPPRNWQSDEPYLRELRSRLALEDPFISASLPSDDPIEQAVLADSIRLFQKRNGLVPDGKLGRRTVAALNIPPSQRVAQIVANMERWRWMPRAPEVRYIVVNVPENKLRAIDHGTTVLRSRVIVGRLADPTPIVRVPVRGLLINPPWNVPSIIAQREILPKLRKDRFYLAKQDMILKDGPARDPHGLGIAWRALRTMPYHVQQLAGPKSALGQIKLDMPNRFDVYLHDTPGKAAFRLDERFLSHGCVRVQKIQQLASFVMTGDPETGITSTQTLIETGATLRVGSAPIPVYFVYWTAFRGDDGQFDFRPDVYGRDQRLIAQLRSRRNVRVTLTAPVCCFG